MFRKIVYSCICLGIFSTFVSPQQIGGGGSDLGKPISASLGGLIDSNVFKKISQSRPKAKVTAAKKATIKPATVAVSKTGKSGKLKKNQRVSVPDNDSTASVLTFRANPNSGNDRELARLFSNKKDEQDTFLMIFTTVKQGYDAEAAKLGRKNDLAMSLTFFIATCLTVYHNSPEPSDAAIENVYQILADSMIENGNLSNSTDAEKQAVSDRLVYISGLVLAGYSHAKQTNDYDTARTYRQVAGSCLQTLMQIDPDKLSFNENGLQVK